MTLTNDCLLKQRRGGIQRIYDFGKYGLSVFNVKVLGYPFAWEVAVIRFQSDTKDKYTLDYSTSLTNDVELFDTDEETNAFISRAKEALKNAEA